MTVSSEVGRGSGNDGIGSSRLREAGLAASAAAFLPPVPALVAATFFAMSNASPGEHAAL